ncbi:MAG: hypothetical protein Q9225_001588 [Loekoesia sp. 1 TL-2023]
MVCCLLIYVCTSEPIPRYKFLHQRAIAGGVDLRILPLGDSITWGQYSSDGNGYRLALYNSLTLENHVAFIGREKSGTMANNENEGHPGFPIDPVGNTGKPDYALRPNIVLLMAGTNDVVFDIDLDTAPLTMGTVIDDIVSSCPDAALLVAQIPTLLDPLREKRRIALNTAIKDVVEGRFKAGKQVALASMENFTVQHLNVTDGIHPNDEGYRQIASAWYDAIVAAGGKGWIKAPVHTGVQSELPDSQIAERWTPARFAMYGLIALGVLVVVRKVLIIIIRNHDVLWTK